MIKIPCIKDADKLEQWIRGRSDEELKFLYEESVDIAEYIWDVVDDELIGRGL